MIIEYHGHSEFLLESARGFRVLTDPYDAHTGYPMTNVRADAITVSHDHGDHHYTKKVPGTPMILSRAGETRLTPDVMVRSIPAFHDDVQGAKRGQTLLTVVQMDGLTIAHMGDVGAPLTEEQRKALGAVDLLLLPVGGFYTIDAQEAARMVRQIKPHTVIPMHYQTRFNRDWPIADETEFLHLMGADTLSPMPLIRITRQDLACLPAVVLMSVQE